jgi:hypothetical protein
LAVFVRVMLFAIFASAAFSAEPVPIVGQLHFQGIFAWRAGGNTTYCLLGVGYLQALRSHDDNRVIGTWIAAHPKAEIVLVDTPLSGHTSRGDVGLQYIWVRSGEDFLNVALIREGVFAGSVMIDPAEMFTGLPPNTGGPPREVVPRRLVSNEQYEAFKQRIADAEALAWKERKGIWSDEFKQYRQDDPSQ